MARVYIPQTLREFVNNDQVIEVPANSVTEALSNLCDLHENLKPHIYYQNGMLKPHLMVAVNGEQSTLKGSLNEDDIVELIFAAAGG